ncbi:MAG: hypothetical protein OEV30_05755 [Ignavibacteria bacterium]|nr:hypothetical protein [Ignavibacteria bacterium]
MSEQLQMLFESLRAFWVRLGEFLPQLIGALLIFVVGWIIAKVIRSIVTKLLKTAKVDSFAEKAGIEGFLSKGGGKLTTISIIGTIVYWFIMFGVILAVLNSLNLTIAAELFNRIVLYIPNVFVAVVVLVLGAMLATFVQGILRTFLSNTGFSAPEMVSNIARVVILVFVGFVALEQLSIGGEILVSAFQLGFAAVCLALAIAFGLGGKDWAARILAKLESSSTKKD